MNIFSKAALDQVPPARPSRPPLAASLRAADAADSARFEAAAAKARRADDERHALAMAVVSRVDDMCGRRVSLESAQTVRAIKSLLDRLAGADAVTRFLELEPEGLGRGSPADLAALEAGLRGERPQPPAAAPPEDRGSAETGNAPPASSAAAEPDAEPAP